MRLSRRCWGTAARSPLDYSVAAKPADLTTLLQRINSPSMKPCKTSVGGLSCGAGVRAGPTLRSPAGRNRPMVSALDSRAINWQ
jgi:hypothetical protein